jgi:ATP-binding cassette subfamily F protein uup
VEAAPTAGHVKLTAACQALDEARAKVEQLFSRWEELAAKRGGG